MQLKCHMCYFSNMQVVPVISARCHSGKGSRTVDALSSSAVSSGEVTTCRFMIHFMLVCLPQHIDAA